MFSFEKKLYYLLILISYFSYYQYQYYLFININIIYSFMREICANKLNISYLIILTFLL